MDGRKTILVVEDERIVARDIQRSLADLGYDVPMTAASAEQAIACASKQCPDLVLMDIHIKGDRDGIATAAILRERFGVPVVYLTAYTDSETIERAKITEPYGYVLKPIKTDELRSIVEIALYKHVMDRQIRERERWFANTLQSIGDGVVTVDLAGNITFVNTEAEALIGVTATEVVGRSAQEVLKLLDENANMLGVSPIERVLRDRRRVDLNEIGLQNASTGAVRLIDDTAAPVLDEGRLLGAVMVFRDVTEQKSLHKQLELADRLASLGTLAAGVAHEVNNPLAVVVANTDFIRRKLEKHRADLAEAGIRLTAEAEHRLDSMKVALQDVLSAGNRIGRLVSDLRGFTRPAKSTYGRADVLGAVEWALRATAHELRQLARVVTKLNPVPMVEADETRLGQVFLNLLMNAAQAISPGNAEENEVEIETTLDKNGRVQIDVRDTGCGMSEENRKRIFDPFFTTRATGSGTGLGLPISHGIVTSLGGEIHVTSEVGKGTVVRIVLPAAREQKEKEVPAAGEIHHRKGRILVIDDEEMVLRAIARILVDHDLVCVGSAREALELLEQGDEFDLIFSDVVMPTMTGAEFYEELLRRSPEMARRVLFLSGGATTTRIEDFLQSVPNVRIEKPFDVDGLLETVQRLLEQQAVAPAKHTTAEATVEPEGSGNDRSK